MTGRLRSSSAFHLGCVPADPAAEQTESNLWWRQWRESSDYWAYFCCNLMNEYWFDSGMTTTCATEIKKFLTGSLFLLFVLSFYVFLYIFGGPVKHGAFTSISLCSGHSIYLRKQLKLGPGAHIFCAHWRKWRFSHIYFPLSWWNWTNLWPTPFTMHALQETIRLPQSRQFNINTACALEWSPL